MTTLSLITLGLTLTLGLVFLAFFLWAVKDGQFNDPEEAKYEMFRNPNEKGEERDE